MNLVRDVVIIKNPRIRWGTSQDSLVSGRHSQGPPFPASVVIFIMLMLLHTIEVLINKELG